MVSEEDRAFERAVIARPTVVVDGLSLESFEAAEIAPQLVHRVHEQGFACYW